MKKGLYSIRKLQRIMIFLFLIPILALQLTQSLLSFQELSSEMEENGRSIIYLYQQQMDSDVHRISTTIANYWAQEYSHKRLLYAQSPLDAYKYAFNVLDTYRTLMNVEPTVAAIFLVSGANDIVRGAFTTTHTTYEERLAMRGYVDGLAESWGENSPRRWRPVQLAGRYFLVCDFCTQSAGTVCFIDLDQILSPQASASLTQDTRLLFADESGTPLSAASALRENGVVLRSGEDGAYFSGNCFIVQRYSPVSGIYMVFLETSPVSLKKINRLILVILALSLLVSALVPLPFLMLKRWYLRPMEQMDRDLLRIRSGQMAVRFREDQKVEELQKLSTSFNSMMDQVKDLKIEAYETELKFQYAQLQYLQLQISPHFFLNILKSLYGMAQGRDYRKIQDAILMVSDHVRYIFHDNKDRVALRTELRHVENYINMQRYVTAQPIDFQASAEPGLEGALIPALCLQTFVENSCKYAMLPGQALVLSLELRRLRSDAGDSLDITIRDNGPGLPAALLEEYNRAVSFDYRENHIGILNIRQRLHLLYGDRFGFACRNLAPGTEFELIFPLHFEESQRKTDGRPCI